MIHDLRRYMDAVQTLVEAQPNKNGKLNCKDRRAGANRGRGGRPSPCLFPAIC